MVQENLHERGAVQIRQLGNFADNTDVAELLNRLAIFAILIANEHHTVNRVLCRM